MTQQKEALRLLEEVLEELDSPKGSVLSAIQKLYRACELTEKLEIRTWCSIQLGDPKYTHFFKVLKAALKKPNTDYEKALADSRESFDKLNLDPEIYLEEALSIKAEESGGGYQNIGFIEEKYAELVRTKRGNDGTFYKDDLNNHINYIRRKAHEFASTIFNQVKFSGTTSNCFDLLKEAVDDRLLDLNPLLAEKLMLVFKSVSSGEKEEWSQALTTCRRLLEGIADEFYPARETPLNGRSLKQSAKKLNSTSGF